MNSSLPPSDHPTAHLHLKKRTLVIICTVCALLAGTVIYKLTVTKNKPTALAAVPVTVSAVRQQDMQQWISTVGTVTPINTVSIKSRVDGQLQKILFTEGQEVKAGSILAEIDPRPFKAQLSQVRANLQKDLATLNNLQLDVARYTKLAEIGAGTGQNLDNSKAQLAAQEATVAADRAQLDNALLQLNYATLTAPFDGRLGIRQLDAGTLIHASDATGLVTLTQMQPITVLFAVPQQYLTQLLDEQRQQPLTVQALSNDTGQLLDQGLLTLIDNQVDQANGQVKLKATFTNAQRHLWPGQSVTAQLLLSTHSKALAIPNMALVTGQQGSYVYVISDQQKARVQYVKTGIVDGDYTEVTSGLSAEQVVVVVNGQNRLKEGSSVHITAADKHP